MFSRSLQLGRVANIDVRLHWSLVLGCAFFYVITPTAGAGKLVVATAVMLSVFLSITAHEFGHALVARRLGYATRQIVLWILGGLAFLEREPRRTRDKILIAVAGPLVNLAIAGVCAGLGVALAALIVTSRNFALTRWLYAPIVPPLSVVQIGSMVIAVNLVLALFNLLPIYPLDGGRILRAALTPRLGERRADLLALLIGMPIAGGLLIFFIMQRAWVSVGETLLLLLVASALHPWFNRRLTLASMWWLHRGSYYAFAQHDYDRALAYADQQIARGRRLSEHHVLRSYVLLKAGDLAAAWAAADQAVRLQAATNAERAMALNNRGAIAWLQDDAAAARADLDQAIQADPTFAYAYSSRGEIAAELGDIDTALTDLTTAIEIAPQFVEARYHRAALRFRLGDLEGACTDAAFVFADDRSDSLNWSEREIQHSLTNQLPWAQQIAAWAHTQAWSVARVQRFLGDALRVNGRATEAVAAYTQALVATPADAILLLRRAQAYQVYGMIDAARADIERLLAARPTPHTRQCAEALLATLTAATTVLSDHHNLPILLGEPEQELG